MFSDIVIMLFGVTSCLNGWHRGFSRSLRGLIATAAAVAAAPYVYPRLAVWLYGKLDVDAAQATVIAYLICLFVFMAMLTAVLVQLFNSYWEEDPWTADRLGGFLYGGIKVAVIVVLATAVSLAPIQTSAPTVVRLKLGNGNINLAAAGSNYFLPPALPLARQLAESSFGKRYILAKP